MRFIGIDLGSSFIKGAVLDLDALAIQHLERLPFPDPLGGLDPVFREFNPAAVVAATRSLLERLRQHAPEATGLVMCSQLHGLVLTNGQGQARSNVLNWQDQRALQPWPGGHGSYFDEVNRRLTFEERRQLGNEARPGVPLCYLFWLAQNQLLPADRVTATSLPNFVLGNLCGGPPPSDVTHAAAHGALNLETLNWHRPVIEKLGLGRVGWPDLVPQGAVVGQYGAGSRRLTVFAPVGDYHCSQVGACLDAGELSVNISTGSAVIQWARGFESGDFQTRPWFDGRFLKTITHIPGGRALDALVRLLSELAEGQGLKLRDPWDYILTEAAKVESTELRVDPAFYFSATGDRGAITHAREGNLTVGHLFHATFAGMADNYARCAVRLSPGKTWTRLVFSGGVALKATVLRQLICDRLGQAHRLAATAEDTLLGLLVLALHLSGRFPSVAEAMAFARLHYRAPA